MFEAMGFPAAAAREIVESRRADIEYRRADSAAHVKHR
jgi:hypothetical protein